MEEEKMGETPSNVDVSPKPAESSKKEEPKKSSYKMWIVAAIIVLVILFFVWKWNSAGYENEAVLIGSCEECIDLLTPAQGLGLEITQVDTKEATKLIEKYSIRSEPALLIFTDEPLPFQAEMVEDAYVIQELPPYRDLQTGELRGQVDIEVVQTDCADCFDIEVLVDNFAQTFPTTSITYVNATPELIEQYDLSVLPALLVGGDIDLYPITSEYGQFVNGKLVVTSYPPYHDLVTGETLGVVDATYIIDPSCETCSTEQLELMLEQVQVTLGKVETREKSRASALIGKYNITALPTVVLSEDLRYYPGVLEFWPQVGTIEEDGVFVFREHELLQMQAVAVE